MNNGVPKKLQSPSCDSLLTTRRSRFHAGRKTLRAGLLLFGSLLGLPFGSAALAAPPATVGLGAAASFSVLGGSTVTNTGATKMFGDLGLSPGSSLTGAPQVLGQTHIDDAVAIGAKSALTTAYTHAESRPSNGSAGTDLAGQTFSPGVYTASEGLLLSSGSVTLNAGGNPDAVFIFQIGSTLITGSNTAVSLVGGAQACNVFWQVGSSATLGSGTQFAGTIMASASITANTTATIHGRLLAQTAAVTLENNTITTSNCASSASGRGGGTETTTPQETAALKTTTRAAGTTTTTTPATTPRTPTRSKSTVKRPRLHRRHRTHRTPKRRSPARPALPHKHGSFTG